MKCILLISFAVLVLSGSAAYADAAGSGLGKVNAQCRLAEPGPAVWVNVVGLKDRTGLLKMEVYPSVEGDFLGDDTNLVNAGKTFRRVEMPVPATGMVTLCTRLPGAGAYSIVVLHDRNANHKFDKFSDGIGFSGNPKLHMRAPTAAETRWVANGGRGSMTIVMNYWHGFLSFGPVKGS
ncbi:MAG: DUF2141 domain-containing protein [Alphaproteobacteria bacterium]|nr:DUF2141 domain-containing protein [Alphaproteobacteria bacterium]MDE2041477.1 DUF2141 domain-containing protein [Alphaproteobacteria bacterium]MDE2341146.1 DUF2141 domain-containing protein [Alphaproteobacteria bacterium]